MGGAQCRIDGSARPIIPALGPFDLASFATMMTRYAFLIGALFAHFLVVGQTTIAPQSVTCTLDAFSPTCAVDNLIEEIGPGTSTSTAFSFSPWSNFSTGIGFVSDYGQWEGSITYTFVNSTSVSRMMVWNAYFNFELDHSLRNALLTFYNSSDQVITTANVTFPQAVSDVLTPQVVNLATEVLGVKRVMITVGSLWGGNEISLRRMAFAGNGLVTGIDEDGSMTTLVSGSPNPARDNYTISVVGARSVGVFDAIGRSVALEAQIDQEQVVLRWDHLAPGTYHVIIHTATGQAVSRVLVE